MNNLSIITKTIVQLLTASFILASLLIITTPVMLANAADIPEQAIKDFNTAIADAKRQVQKIQPNQRFSYIREELNQQDVVSLFKFVPVGIDKGEWQQLNTPQDKQSSQNEETQSNLDWNDNLIQAPTNLAIKDAQLVKATKTHWIFKIPNTINVNIGESNDQETNNRAKELQDKVSGALPSLIQTEITISKSITNKQKSKLIAYHVFNTKTFKPSFMAKVTKFDINIEYDEAWPNGPLVTKSLTKEIKGSYGFFVSIDELNHYKLSEFSLVNLENKKPAK